jgi:SAM-dependent methyltransferase
VYSSDLAFVHDAGFADVAAKSAPAIVALLRRHGIRRGTIVEAGCGSGIVAERLVAAGHDVVGFDVSAAMVKLARSRVPKGRFTVRSIAGATIPACDAVIAIGEVVTYVRGGLPALRRFFDKCHRAVRPGGLLIFDFIESAQGRTFPVRTIEGDRWTLTVSADFDRERRTLTRRMTIVRAIGGTIRRSRETHHVRVYSRRELTAALRAAGFTASMSRNYGRYRLMRGDVAVIARRD